MAHSLLAIHLNQDQFGYISILIRAFLLSFHGTRMNASSSSLHHQTAMKFLQVFCRIQFQIFLLPPQLYSLVNLLL
ncbi:hypothetical protein CH063_02133 [Colletotrichum higginsianum]|uniref:Uncharacterized protein n=1 Tax=Colletotrichum higginsianum (strain IMI 349063) TaxID=759273 RepID=H1VGU8_COLHI|nr:hypothetical protein CH063_02133 [Colletotrichum higginsianum]